MLAKTNSHMTPDFLGIFDLPTLIRYFTTNVYLVKTDAAWITYLPKNLTSYLNATLFHFQWKVLIFMDPTVNLLYQGLIVDTYFSGTERVKTLFIWLKVMWKVLLIVLNLIRIYLP